MIQVYNTLTRRKEEFQTVVPGKVGIYLCGPTVYKPSHIGHAVGPIIFDAIVRYLRFRGYDVTWIVNITDVEDKLIAESQKQGRPMLDIAREVEANYKESMQALGVRQITAFPRATEFMGEIIGLVERLIVRGAAYAVPAQGAADATAQDVYFDHTAKADYGKLSNRRPEDQQTGTRQIAGDNRRHAADFALWKASAPGEPAWDSPWGKGRPGWHIECSAMSLKILGETFDIHGGGLDLVFPHHENEIAQSEAATGKPFVRYWLHNGLTRIATKLAGGEIKAEKMSKSLGNIRTITSLLEQITGETIRYFVLSTHYRRPLDFSDEQLAASGKALENFYRALQDVERLSQQDPYAVPDTQYTPGTDQKPLLVGFAPGVADALEAAGLGQGDVHAVGEFKTIVAQFFEAMDDDFNTANAIATLNELRSAIGRFIASHWDSAAGVNADQQDMLQELLAGMGQTLVRLGRLLGLFEAKPVSKNGGGITDADIANMVEARNAAKKAKDFARADEIRKQLKDMGITLEDTPKGVIWRRG